MGECSEPRSLGMGDLAKSLQESVEMEDSESESMAYDSCSEYSSKGSSSKHKSEDQNSGFLSSESTNLKSADSDDSNEDTAKESGIGSETSQVANFTLETKYFLEVLTNFRLKCNRIDPDLSDVLDQVLDSISKFLDGEPSLVHSSNKTIPYINFGRSTLKKQYFCEICQETITDTSAAVGRHLHSEKHRFGMNVYKTGDKEKISSLKRQRRLETIIEENPDIIVKVLKRKAKHEKKAEQEQNLPKKVKMFMLGDFSTFLQEAVEKANKIKSCPMYKKISEHLKHALLPRFPEVKIFFFGSRICGLANDKSDLNILIDTGTIPPNIQSPNVILEVTNTIKYLLKENDKIWRNCILREHDKYVAPLFAYNVKLEIKCDIWVSHFIVYWEGLLIDYFNTNLPIFQDVCLFVKHWIKETRLNEHFSSYVVTWLVVFCFQAQRALPPISFLQTNIQPVFVGPWIANFSNVPLKDFGISSVSRDYDSACYFITKFFQFYSNFEFEKFVICPYLGYPIQRNTFLSFFKLLPQYYNFIAKNPQSTLPMISPVCFQNPIEQNRNIAVSISQGGLKLFRQYCMQSMKILTNKKKTMVPV